MSRILIGRSTVEQALEALEKSSPQGFYSCKCMASQHWPHCHWKQHQDAITALKAVLAEPTVKESLQVESAFAENATTQQQLEEAPPSDYRRGYWDGFEIGKREGRIEAENALAEPVQEPWEHLKQYGYAPGSYMSRCHSCDKIASGVDKRAITCRPCAEVRRAALAEPVQEAVACLIGTKNSAFDLPTTKRAYTYAKQPGNVVASRLGLACDAAASQSAGDSIDCGLGLLQELQRQGFGVFDLGAEYTAPPQRKPLTEEEIVALIHPIVMADMPDEMTDYEIARAVERAIKRAHGIGGEG